MADLPGHQGRTATTAGTVSHIEVGLVQRQGFNLIGIAQKDGPQLAGNILVERHAPRQQHQGGTELFRQRRRHGGTYAETAGHIVAGGDDATAIGCTADRQRHVTQRRVVPHLHRRIKAVHVDMDDLAHTTV